MFIRRIACVVLLIVGATGAGTADAALKFRAADPRAALCHTPRVVDTFRPSSSGGLSSAAVVGVLDTFYGPVHVAIDTRGADEPRAVTFDFTGTGAFADATPVPVVARKSGAYFWGELQPTKIDIERGGQSFTVGVMGSVYRSESSQSVDVQLGTMLESSCRFGTRLLNVDIIDGDQNLRFGDKTRIDGEELVIGDTLVIRDGSRRYKVLFGQPVRFDGKWYELNIRDDYTLEAIPLDIPVGEVQVPHREWSAILIGEKYIFGLSGDAEPVTIPVDTYTVARYEEHVGKAMISCLGHSDQSVTVQADKRATVKVGSPIVGLPVLQQTGDRIVIHAKLVDASGLAVSELRLPSGNRPPPPIVGIFDAQGRKLYQATLEYG